MGSWKRQSYSHNLFPTLPSLTHLPHLTYYIINPINSTPRSTPRIGPPAAPKPKPRRNTTHATLPRRITTTPSLLNTALEETSPQVSERLLASGTVRRHRATAARIGEEIRVQGRCAGRAVEGGGGQPEAVAGGPRARETRLLALLVRPPQQPGDDLQDLELLGIRPV